MLQYRTLPFPLSFLPFYGTCTYQRGNLSDCEKILRNDIKIEGVNGH